MACTYRFKDASGKEVVITGQAAMKAYLAEGGLQELLGGNALYEINANGDPSPEEAESVHRGLEGKNPIEAAAWLADNAPPAYAAIAKKVRDKLQSLSSMGVNFGLSVVNPGQMAPAGMSVARGGTFPVQSSEGIRIEVMLNGAGMTGRVGTSYRTALHELLHAATLHSIQLGYKGVPQYAQAHRDLVDVANAIGDHLNARAKAARNELTDFERGLLNGRMNMFQSVDEVLAWGLSSAEAQAYMEGIPYKRKSAWSAFVGVVRKILGLPADSETALSEVLRVADVMLQPINADALFSPPEFDGVRYEVQNPAGGRVFLNPGARPEAKWTDAPATLRTDTLPDTITVDGIDRPTTNSKGQQIHPTEDGVRNFWKWFLDSKALDDMGRPLVVYHGTAADFDEYDFQKTGQNFGDGSGAFFTASPSNAGAYANGEGANIMPAYLDLKNPLRVRFDGFNSDRQFFHRRAELLEKAKNGEHDGIIAEDNSGNQTLVVFSPEQVKSATGNAGTFSPESADIRLRDSAAEPEESGPTREQAEDFIRRFVAEYPAAPEIILSDSFYQLPERIQQDATAQGSGPNRAKGALKNGKAYVILNNHRSMADLEATLFHEVLGHSGVRKLLGENFSRELNKLFIGLGGYSGLKRIMDKRGMGAQFEGYMGGVEQARAKNPDAWTDALAQSILTEEVFAHIAEQKSSKALRDRFMALVGMVRDWLRTHGFAELANLGESDVVFMLQRAREGLRNGDGVVRDGVTVGESVIVDSRGRPLAKEGSPEYEAMKILSERLGLRETTGPTVFSDSLPDPEPALNQPSASASTDAPSVFRTEVVGPRSVRTRLAEFFDSLNGESAKTFNWWQRTIGSQYGKAKSDRDFGRVYDAAHAFLDGVADFAKSASALAPNILPHLDTLRDVAKGANVKRQWSDSKDYQAISSAIFEGTLSNGTTGQVWSDQELRDRFGLNDRQISLYREFRQSVDFSLETLAASEMARLARAAKLEVAGRDVGMDEALAFYMKQLDPILKEARAAVEGKAAEFVARHAEERAVLADASVNLTDAQTKLLRDEMDRRHKRELDELMAVERDAEALRDSFVGSVEQIRRLEEQGYAPLMRFGQYTVDVVKLDEEGKPAKDEEGAADRPFFGMFETEAEAKRAAKILSEEYPGYAVTQGVLSVDSSQLYRGLTPETAELFSRLLGTDEAGAFQAYLKQAVANRSATKRLINRMGIEGFSNDVPRVLAAFITSNARLASGNWHFGEMSKAAEAIPKHKGDVKDEAIRLMQYVQNPQEEAAGLRGFLFFSFLGGSIASAITNLTQTFSTTLPYLHQFAGPAVAKVLPKAMALSGKMMTKGLDAVPPGELRDALKKASDEGVVDPQEIHLLMAESGGNGASIGLSGLAGAINKEWATPAARVTRSLTQAWGMFFGAAEKYNRHVAFIAAWEVAPDGVDRYEFAKNAVTETQFDYTKASRPNWARGAVGATLFTFKTFAVNYVEFMSRLPPRERAVALGVLFLMAGLSGMPGADDLDDVVDTVAQKMGYNWNNSAARHAWLVKTLTAGGADFVERGLSSLLPLDVSARLGMGNLVPGSGVLMKSNDKPARDIQEFFGPIGSVFASGKDVFDNVGTGKGAFEAVKPLAPKSMGDIAQAIDMIQTGQYRDRAGRKVVDVDALDAAIKAIGFQPNVVAGPRRVERMLAQSAAMHRAVRQDIHTLMARGRYEGDADKIEAAREMMRTWNEKNPETPIRLNPTSVAQRVRAMRQTSAERLVKATPKDMRGALSAELAVSQ